MVMAFLVHLHALISPKKRGLELYLTTYPPIPIRSALLVGDRGKIGRDKILAHFQGCVEDQIDGDDALGILPFAC
jgi:hypothetical protein